MIRLYNLMEQYLNSLDKTRDVKSHWVSDGKSCLRKQYYKWNNIKKSNPINAATMIKMEAGNVLEQELFYKALDYAVETKLIKSYEKQCKEHTTIQGLKYPVSTKPDAIIEYLDGTKVVGECKSGYGRNIAELKKLGQPSDSILFQCCMYSTIFKLPVHIYYFGRDTGYSCEFFIKPEKGNFIITDNFTDWKPIEFDYSTALQKFKDIEAIIIKDMPPEREYNCIFKNGELKKDITHNTVKYKSDWQCLYCNWLDTCWKSVLKAIDNSILINDNRSK